MRTLPTTCARCLPCAAPALIARCRRHRCRRISACRFASRRDLMLACTWVCCTTWQTTMCNYLVRAARAVPAALCCAVALLCNSGRG